MDAFYQSVIRADCIRVPEIYITGRTESDRNWWKGNDDDVWSLTRTFRQIYERLDHLQEEIDNIDGGGGGGDDGPPGSGGGGAVGGDPNDPNFGDVEITP